MSTTTNQPTPTHRRLRIVTRRPAPPPPKGEIKERRITARPSKAKTPRRKKIAELPVTLREEARKRNRTSTQQRNDELNSIGQANDFTSWPRFVTHILKECRAGRGVTIKAPTSMPIKAAKVEGKDD